MRSLWLTAIILGVIIITGCMIMTNDITPKERDEMLDDEEMWP